MSAKNITLRELRAFVAVADKGSFVQAAAVVNLSQPALSQRIRQLEEKVGSALFVRTTRSLNLTPLGVSFLTSARHMLRQFDTLMEDVSDVVTHRRGHVTIACLPSVASRLMPRIMKINESRFPGIRVTIRDTNMRGVTSALVSGEADLGIGGQAADHVELASAIMARDQFQAVLPVTSPLSRRRVLHWADLADTPFVAMTHESGVPEFIDRALEENGLSLSTVAEVTNISTLMGMVEEGVGVTALPGLVVPRTSQALIRTRPLIDPVLTRTIRLYWKRGQGLSPAASALVQSLIQTLESGTDSFHFPNVEWTPDLLRAAEFD